METTKHIIIVFALFLFVTGTAISEESQISNTRQASCVVQITFKPVIMSLNFEDIESLLHSSGVLGKAAQEVLDSTSSQVGFIDIDSVRSSPTSTGMLTYSFGLNILLPETLKPAAKEFINNPEIEMTYQEDVINSKVKITWEVEGETYVTILNFDYTYGD